MHLDPLDEGRGRLPNLVELGLGLGLGLGFGFGFGSGLGLEG